MSDHASSTTRPRCVAVTGATGFVGRHLVRELVKRGHSVRALVRDRKKAARTLSGVGVSQIEGDIFDAASMDDLARGADAMIHLIGIRREMPGGVTFERMHVNATSAAVDAAQRAGVRRYVHMSALGARPEAASAYHQTKWKAEQLVRHSNLDWTIIRPSLILGPDGEFMEMAKGWVRGTEPPKRFLPYFMKPVPTVGARTPDSADRSAMVQPVSVRNVATAFGVAAERDDAIGEIYPIVGPEPMTWPQLLAQIRDVTPGANHKLKPFGIPGDIAAHMAFGLQKIGLGALLPFGSSEPVMATEDNTGSDAKARIDLGLEPEKFESTLRWCVAA